MNSSKRNFGTMPGEMTVAAQVRARGTLSHIHLPRHRRKFMNQTDTGVGAVYYEDWSRICVSPGPRLSCVGSCLVRLAWAGEKAVRKSFQDSSRSYISSPHGVPALTESGEQGTDRHRSRHPCLHRVIHIHPTIGRHPGEPLPFLGWPRHRQPPGRKIQDNVDD